MKKELKFIHVSDIHLGANPYMLKERYNDMRDVFDEVITYAEENEVDFVLIPGDLFDKKVINAETLDQAINLFKRLNKKEIPVYVTEGNHDMATYVSKYSWLEFMSQKGYITLLKPFDNALEEWNEETKSGSFIETDDYIVYGLGYPGVNAKNFLEKVTEDIKASDKPIITMLHAGIDKFVTEGMGGLREEEIENLVSLSDYIALGHIHQRYDNKDMKYYNPGSIENTTIPQNIDEKGFYSVILDTETKDVETSFIKVNNRKIISLIVDLSSKENDDNDDNDNNNNNNNEDTTNNTANRIEHIDFIESKVAEYLNEINYNKEDKAILYIKLRGNVKESGLNLDVSLLKEHLIRDYDFLYVEIQNKVNGQKVNMSLDDATSTREDIDKTVIKSLIEDLGFNEDDSNKLLKVTLDMKNAATSNNLTLENEEGKDVVSALLEFVREKHNKTV